VRLTVGNGGGIADAGIDFCKIPAGGIEAFQSRIFDGRIEIHFMYSFLCAAGFCLVSCFQYSIGGLALECKNRYHYNKIRQDGVYMKDNFTRMGFDSVIRVENIITLFYMELSKSFAYDGERHDFWEMVYIDKGEMVCTADKNRFVLKSGEMTFHKPNEFHNLSGDNKIPPNVSIVTFECRSRAMRFFEGRIFKLDAEEKTLLSMLFAEGLSCYRLVDEKNPLLQNLEKLENAPFGSSQMTKNLLEIFLIKLCRHTDGISKNMRQQFVINNVDVNYNVKEILDFLQENIYKKITIHDVAKSVGKSESTVKQLFSTYQKHGIIQYFNSLKIKEARRLLRETDYNIMQISDLLCFDTPQYFSKCFKAYTHMTPSEYKASIKLNTR